MILSLDDTVPELDQAMAHLRASQLVAHHAGDLVRSLQLAEQIDGMLEHRFALEGPGKSRDALTRADSAGDLVRSLQLTEQIDGMLEHRFALAGPEKSSLGLTRADTCQPFSPRHGPEISGPAEQHAGVGPDRS